ncbi:YqaJ viral recombinase family protein [Flavonifractor plautii]|uniref:YqaJ viral recombinase family nuclease n=1 Tax=Flavonifractor plautii TaxID=292800 RepID=UPI001FAC13A1|nr:YqaJ viral recombinase family protein [Flavonifractor plautii]MDB7879489.1 YqaJ viral recombinase family protein [Flavonifractor plautii]
MPASNVAAEKRSQPQILVETAGLSEEEWLAYRRKGIGGSDVAALLGISPWRTARDLYFDKLNIVAVEDNEDNWVALEMGHLLEPLVAKIFQHRTGYKVYQIKKMFQHPQYSWMLADVDYFVELPDGSTAILEIKTTNYNARDNWWLNGEETVPVYYETQGRHYMAVMNVDRCFFCCLYGNNEEETIIREIRRDESYEEEMIFLEQYFWENHVLTRTPPPYTEDGDLVLESVRRHTGSADQDAPVVTLDLSLTAKLMRYTSPHNYFIPMLSRSPHVPSLPAVEGSDEFLSLIEEFQTTDDSARVQEIFNQLLNFDNDNVLDLPLLFVKDMIVYNTDKIAGYDFSSTPMFFDVRLIQPAE